MHEILASIYVPLADNRMINTMVNDGMSMDEAIDKWLADNAKQVDLWKNIKDY